MNTFHLSGYPRIGAKRELKFAVEAFWKGAKSEAELQAVAAEIRRLNWAAQKAAGADLLPVGDFSFYDQVLDTQVALGCIPKRFGFARVRQCLRCSASTACALPSIRTIIDPRMST